MKQFYLPDLGEGLQGAELLEWKVAEGERVKLDQLILVVETAKAVVEIPSPVDAVIEKLYYSAGDTVEVGAILMEYREMSDANDNQHEKLNMEEGEALVQNVAERTRKGSVSVVGRLEEGSKSEGGYDDIIIDESPEEAGALQSNNQRIKAPPSVQLFARKLGLGSSLGPEVYGVVSESSLMNQYVAQHAHEGSASGVSESIMKLKGARKVMAQTMSRSHEQIPAVTLFDDANISHWHSNEDMTLRCIRALIRACHDQPILNAWFDEEDLSIRLFDDINLGVAVNSREGLFVPVIRKAQTLSDERIRAILQKQISAIHDRSIKPQKLLGATISLSNFGSLGGRYATPIIVPPQVAIVGVGTRREEPIVKDGKVSVGTMLPLSLSFDHRAASGADAAKFMKALIAELQS